MIDSVELVGQLTALPAPPGQEQAAQLWLTDYLATLGYKPSTDSKGNVLVDMPGNTTGPNVLVTAHMDEIALMITRIEDDGKIRVAAYGGVYAWKWGEGPVEIMLRDGLLPGVLSFGCIHTNDEKSVAEYARHHPLGLDRAYVFTGLTRAQLDAQGVRAGLRVIIARSRRALNLFGAYVSGYFLDDRVDIAAMLLALETLQSPEQQSALRCGRVTFAATTSEEVGGEGALWILNNRPADICVALEIGPRTPEADFAIDAQPTIWVRDGYAAMSAQDGDILADACRALGQTPHWQYLSRGGSDASCAASKGLCARPVTLGFPVENSHGYEIMHKDAPAELARLLVQYLKSI